MDYDGDDDDYDDDDNDKNDNRSENSCFIHVGTWTTFGIGGCSNEETAEAVVALAYDSGINVFDLSEAHSGHRAEIQFGRILLRRAWNRSSYVVTTKIYWNTK
ncbi:hypothetical protein E2986_13645 [Frieseomelitta varia]|uniref:NADP-dependent oxidoreductase domain-containing protein n=1 Tax=Frieseomelitta varia TaxID=561572 RepID=A0A833SH91_9HYME|nr:hypothetical protein E2986_13645 [Frieseomelitta varia]